MGVSPCPDLGWGTPHQQDGVPPSRPEMGVPPPPISRMGYPLTLPVWTWDWVPTCLEVGWGTPLPRRGVN